MEYGSGMAAGRTINQSLSCHGSPAPVVLPHKKGAMVGGMADGCWERKRMQCLMAIVCSLCNHDARSSAGFKASIREEARKGSLTANRVLDADSSLVLFGSLAWHEMRVGVIAIGPCSLKTWTAGRLREQPYPSCPISLI